MSLGLITFLPDVSFYLSQEQMDMHLHIVFENICSSGHIYNVVDDEFAESCEQVSPLVESLDLVGLVLLISLYSHQYKWEKMKPQACDM